MESPLFLTLLLLVLFLLSAVFSGSEAAYIAINRIRLRNLREKKARGAESVFKLVSRLEELITTILVCNNLANTSIAAIGAVICVKYIGPEWGVIVSTAAVALALLIFCETTPKIFATRHPEKVALAMRHLMHVLIYVFRPVVRISNRVSSKILKILGVKPRQRNPIITEEEIKLMLKVGGEEGYYSDEERKMLEKIIHFDEIDVLEVMTPFEKMVTVDIDFDEDVLADILMEKGHNRIPVYEKDPQNIIGILYVHDLLYYLKNSELIRVRDLLSAPYYVQPDKKVSLLLKEFQKKKIQIALVRAKTGKIMGLVTLEDLIEEIVGEIEEFTPLEP